MTAVAVERFLDLDGPRAFSCADDPSGHLTAASASALTKTKKKEKPSTHHQPFNFSPALYHAAPLPPYSVRQHNDRRSSSHTIFAPPFDFDIQPKPGTHLRLSDETSSVAKSEAHSRRGQKEVERRREQGFDEGEDDDRDRATDVYDDYEDSFLSPLETRSVASSCSSAAGFTNRSPLTNQIEFYDAAEDFFSDGSARSSLSFCTKNENDLCALRLNVLEEIERRKMAEAELIHMQNQCKRLSDSLSQVGVIFPSIQHAEEGQLDLGPASLCQEIVVTRFVSAAVEKVLAQDAAEEAAMSILVAKNHEISRLRDRLRYYETVNHEMSQRNLEIAELASKQRLRRKTRWRSIWSCIGLSVSIGASLLSYSYLQQPMEDTSSTFYHDAQADN